MSRGRPIKFDPDQAAEAAMQVFWARGYESASTAELLQAMELSRSSLYQAFGNKEQLFIRCLHRYRDGLLKRLREQLDAAPSATQFLRELFLGTAASAGSDRARLGCLVFNSASELGNRTDPAALSASDSVERIAALFRTAVARAQREGDIDPATDARALADYLTLGMAGLRTLIKSGVSPERAADAARFVLRGL